MRGSQSLQNHMGWRLSTRFCVFVFDIWPLFYSSHADRKYNKIPFSDHRGYSIQRGDVSGKLKPGNRRMGSRHIIYPNCARRGNPTSQLIRAKYWASNSRSRFDAGIPEYSARYACVMINISINDVHKTTHLPSIWTQRPQDFSILRDERN